MRRRSALAKSLGDVNRLELSRRKLREQLGGVEVSDGELFRGEPARGFRPTRDVLLGLWREQVLRDAPF